MGEAPDVYKEKLSSIESTLKDIRNDIKNIDEKMDKTQKDVIRLEVRFEGTLDRIAKLENERASFMKVEEERLSVILNERFANFKAKIAFSLLTGIGSLLFVIIKSYFSR